MIECYVQRVLSRLQAVTEAREKPPLPGYVILKCPVPSPGMGVPPTPMAPLAVTDHGRLTRNIQVATAAPLVFASFDDAERRISAEGWWADHHFRVVSLVNYLNLSLQYLQHHAELLGLLDPLPPTKE